MHLLLKTCFSIFLAVQKPSFKPARTSALNTSCAAVLILALGTLGGPIIAAMYSSCSEVLMGQQVPALFTIFRVGLGLGSIIGPTVAGW